MRKITCLMSLSALASLFFTAASFAADAPDASIAPSLKIIGKAMAVYAAQNNDQAPASVGALLNCFNLRANSPAGLVMVVLAPTVPVSDDVAGAPRDQQIEWVNQNTCFQVVFPAGKHLTGAAKPSTIATIIEKPSAEPKREKLSVLYADGHVEDRPRAEVEAMAAPANAPAK